eukprot:snap_masked-scaffold363_size195477-processed-gene-0.37 protein:Tk06665 transcript:snap_masked-scaffold363_size195477-processed-gene-0.37-mRNA-1 annotation:"predicted protein"
MKSTVSLALGLPAFIFKTSLHLVAIATCLIAGIHVSVLQYGVDLLLSALRAMGGSINRDTVKAPEQKYSVEPTLVEEANDDKSYFVDEERTLRDSKYPIGPDELIEKAKTLVRHTFGTTKPELLSNNFRFVFPVVGPLEKDEFIEAYSGFKVDDAFPNAKPNFFNFHVDPMEPNRVWLMTRPDFVHTGPLRMGTSGKVIGPTSKRVVPPPQVLSFSFDDQGKCYKMTGGYSVDRTVGNTGGLGGLFGIFYALGNALPFPEAKPWRPSFQWEVFFRQVPQIKRDWQLYIHE